MTVYINGVSTDIPSTPTAGKKKVTNMYYDPATGSIETEVEP